jgi:hypothetical protein
MTLRPRRAFRWRAEHASLTFALLSACGWASLDVLGSPAGTSGPGADSAAEGPDASGSGEPADATGEEGPIPPPTEDCTSSATGIDQWTFDTTVEGWTLMLDPDVQASIAWASSVGDPAPGAVQVDVTPAASDAGTINGGWLEFNGALGDLSERTASAWVWLDSGTTPHLKLFVQTGSQYGWADNGTVYLPYRTWVCVTLPVSSPEYQQASYDPTDTVRIGLEMLGAAPFRVYVDSVYVR